MYHVQTLAQQRVLVLVPMDALAVRAAVQADVVLHVMEANHIMVVEAALLGAQAAQVHAKDAVVVVVVVVHEIAVVGATEDVDIVVVVTAVQDVLHLALQVVVIQQE